jgi:hypothetical protein
MEMSSTTRRTGLRTAVQLFPSRSLDYLAVAVSVCPTSVWVVQSSNPPLYGIRTKPSSTIAAVRDHEGGKLIHWRPASHAHWSRRYCRIGLCGVSSKTVQLILASDPESCTLPDKTKSEVVQWVSSPRISVRQVVVRPVGSPRIFSTDVGRVTGFPLRRWPVAGLLRQD